MSYKSNLQTNNEALSSNNIDLQSLIDQANSLPNAGGVELPALTNEGSASDLLSGKQLIDSDGNIVTGTIATQSAKIITPNTSPQTAVASGVYTTGAVTVAAIPDNYIALDNLRQETWTFTLKDGTTVEKVVPLV